MFQESKLKIGPFSLKLQSDIPTVNNNLKLMYNDYTEYNEHNFVDFNIKLSTQSLLRRFIRPQADFFIDEFLPFKPLPRDQAYAMFEWGVNYCITTKAHQFLMLHAGVVEKNDKAIIMPAHPGSGKSTLTAALCFNGFRLFSDEVCLISQKDDLVYPCTKPINLKNESIDVIDNYLDGAIFSSIATDTHKGTVALLKPPLDSVKRINEPATPNFIIFPKYQAGAKAKLTPIESKQRCFNY